MPHPLARLLQWVFMPRARKLKGSHLYAFSSDDEEEDKIHSAQGSCKARNVRHAHTDWSQRDGRRSVQTSYYNLPASPTKPLRRSTSLPAITPVDDSVLYDSSADPLDIGYILDMPETDLAPPKEPNERPLLRFVKEAESYLAEMLWLEGRGPYTGQACVCGGGGPLYRCEDCTDLRLFCALCTVRAHASLPLHRLKVWTGTHFAKTSLKKLGLRVQLGHVPGQACFNAKTAWGNDFVLLDHTGIHELNVDFCGCEHALPHYRQLLRQRWFPATSTQPKTAATFSLLESYHLLAAQAKISSYQFVTALERRTDNAGSETVKDRYVAFMRIMREWSHLKMMKRAGRGNDPGGIAATPPGACAIECPACPHPGKNVALSVEDVPENKRWLRRLFLAINANFKLKRKKVSSDAVDPSLNRGYAYVVEESAYKTHLAKHDKQLVDAPSKHCNNHDAVRLATSKNATGLSSTGVVCVDCSRHEFKRPLSTGDIQKGERQVNTDYVLNSSLTHGDSSESVFVTYDIACNYATHIQERFDKYGFHALPEDLGWAIPKFHINTHQEWCRAHLNPGYISGCGRCDGEGIERNWSEHIGAGQSTIEMGPGARRDALDNIFAHHNWGKVRKLPYILVKRLIKAVVERDVQMTSFAQYRDALPVVSTQQWTAMVEAWEADRWKNPNPFFISRPAITQGSIRRQLMEEDEAALQAGTAVVLHEKCSASAMLINGIELEDLQRRLRTDIAQLHQHATDRERASMQNRSNAVRRRIEVWAAIQQLYLPAVVALRQRITSQDDKFLLTHNLPLLLPSSLVAHLPVEQSYLEQEWRLRHAQAFDALADLRGRLEVRTHLYKTKDRFVRGQRANTRAQTVIKNVNNRIAAEAERYRAAFGALEVLEPHVSQPGWRAHLRPLLEADIRHLADGEHGQSEGRRTRSWIWEASASPGGLCDNDGYSASGSGVHESLHESLRVEFCKGRARAHRWEEEVERLLSEMVQTLAYHEWDAARWRSRVDQVHLDFPEYREGANVYAYRQAAIRSSLRDKCRLLWAEELTAASLPRKRNIAYSVLSSAPPTTLFTLANFASLFTHGSDDPHSAALTRQDSLSTLATIASSSGTADSIPAAVRDSGIIDPTLSSYDYFSLSGCANSTFGA